MRVILLLALLVASLMAYVRFAPSDVDRWHRFDLAKAPGDHPSKGGFQAVRVTDGPEALAALDAIIRATPRTAVLAGSVQEQFITYVTRSALWGFPDYTTVYVTPKDALANDAQTLTVHGRLRFGRYDFEVNKARVLGWLAQLPPSLVTPLTDAAE